MAAKRGFNFMIGFVLDYINGVNSRLDFELDFDHYFIEHYPKMERENPELADCFAYYLSEEGQDKAHGLSDAEHKKLIIKQYNEFMSALEGGIL